MHNNKLNRIDLAVSNNGLILIFLIEVCFKYILTCILSTFHKTMMINFSQKLIECTYFIIKTSLFFAVISYFLKFYIMGYKCFSVIYNNNSNFSSCHVLVYKKNFLYFQKKGKKKEKDIMIVRCYYIILLYINFQCNLIYALAILWMKKKQAFTLQF